MIVDCHYHYEPRIFPLERMIPAMDRHGIDKVALVPTMVEPFSLHNRIKQVSNAMLRSNLLYLNPLGRFMYRSLLVDSRGDFRILWERYRIIERPDNSSVAEVIRQHPQRFMGWIFVNPAVDPDPLAEVERWSPQEGMIGVKAHPFWHRYPVEKLDPVAAWCRKNNYPLLIHLGADGSGDFRRLPEKYPGIKIVYAHAGIPYFRRLWSYIKDKQNIFVDLSSPYLDPRVVRMTVDYLGAEKCLYGTDGPYGPQAPGEDYDYGWIKGWIESLPLSDRERDRIFRANFESLLP